MNNPGYIGPEAAGNANGLVDNDGFTAYKLGLIKKYPRFFSIEDWAVEDRRDHWEAATAIMPTHVQMGDDNIVSNAALIREFAPFMNACLIKPNQAAEERAQMLAVATAHALGFVSIYSHRSTRPELETYTARAAMGTGAFGGKWTLWGIGRGGLIAATNQAESYFGSLHGVRLPYQGALVLDPQGQYAGVGWAQSVRDWVLG